MTTLIETLGILSLIIGSVVVLAALGFLFYFAGYFCLVRLKVLPRAPKSQSSVTHSQTGGIEDIDRFIVGRN
jgi:hypothetical protein